MHAPPTHLRIVLSIACLFLLAACSDSVPGLASGTDAEEPPFFVADRFGSGPLTLDELQITIPAEVDVAMSADRKVCFFKAVERRALEAGDPADIDPNEFPYWGGEVSRDEWSQHGNYMQRILLAQAIISWAMLDC